MPTDTLPAFTEPWRTTIARNGAIALAVGAGAGLYTNRLAVVPVATLVALWFALGGHVVEMLFLNGVPPRVGDRALLRAVARLVVWFAGGSVLYAGALATRAVLTGHGAPPWPWWTGGVLFVGLELVAHLVLRARSRPSVYDGRG